MTFYYVWDKTALDSFLGTTWSVCVASSQLSHLGFTPKVNIDSCQWFLWQLAYSSNCSNPVPLNRDLVFLSLASSQQKARPWPLDKNCFLRCKPGSRAAFFPGSLRLETPSYPSNQLIRLRLRRGFFYINIYFYKQWFSISLSLTIT